MGGHEYVIGHGCPFCGANEFNVARGFGVGMLGCIVCGKSWRDPEPGALVPSGRMVARDKGLL